MALLGKRFIHPGGRRSSERLLSWADIGHGQRVLDIGCGVGTTAIEVARRSGAAVTAADISPLMGDLAVNNVRSAGVDGLVRVEAADITDLPYGDDTFDCVVAEAVTMFVPRARAARELLLVARPGGRVLATEFYWRRPPAPRRGSSSWARCALDWSSTASRTGWPPTRRPDSSTSARRSARSRC